MAFFSGEKFMADWISRSILKDEIDNTKCGRDVKKQN